MQNLALRCHTAIARTAAAPAVKSGGAVKTSYRLLNWISNQYYLVTTLLPIKPYILVPD